MMSRMNLVATLVAILAVVGTAEQGNLRTRELVNAEEVSEIFFAALCEVVTRRNNYGPQYICIYIGDM